MPKKYQGEAELSNREKNKKWRKLIIRLLNAGARGDLLVPQGPPPKKQKKKAPLGDLVIPRK